MATETLTVRDRLAHLLKLQLIDSKIDEIQVLKGELPIEVSDLEDEIAGLDKRVEKIAGGVDELNTELSNHDANIKEAKALIKKYEKQEQQNDRLGSTDKRRCSIENTVECHNGDDERGK